MFITKDKAILSSDTGQGELGILCLTSKGKWNSLYEVQFTSRTDFENVFLESIFRDQKGSTSFKGMDFKFKEGHSYSYTEEYNCDFDWANSEHHLEVQKGIDSFKEFILSIDPEKGLEYYKEEYDLYSNAEEIDGILHEKIYSRYIKTFMFCSDTHYKKFHESINGLKISPNDGQGGARLFDYGAGMLSKKKEEDYFFLREWVDAMRKAS